jgi:hypothetical protein
LVDGLGTCMARTGFINGASEASGRLEFMKVGRGLLRRVLGVMGVEIDGKAATDFAGSFLGMELDGVEIGLEEVWQGASHEVVVR